MSVHKGNLQVASAVTPDTKTVPETIKIIESLLTQYPISGKPGPNIPFYRDGSGINFEVFAYTLPVLTQDFLARDNVAYFLAKKGDVHNRRTSFIYPGTDGLASAFVVDFCTSANTAKHLAELKKELHALRKEKSEYELETILKNKAFITRFGQLYEKIQIFFLGNGTVPSKELAVAMTMAYPNMPINTLKITQIKISCLPNLNYNQSLVTIIVSLLKWGNANALLFLDTVNDLKTLKKLSLDFEAQVKVNHQKTIAEQAKEDELQSIKAKLFALQQSIERIDHEIKRNTEHELNPLDQLNKSFSESLGDFQSHSEDALSWKIFNLTLLLIKYKFIMDSRKNEHNVPKSLTGVARLKFILEVDPKIKAGFFRMNAESVKKYLGNLSSAFMNNFLAKKGNPQLLSEELQALQKVEIEKLKTWEIDLNKTIDTAEGNWLKKSINFIYRHSLASSIGGILKNFPRASIAMGVGAATFSGGTSLPYSLALVTATYLGTSLLSRVTSPMLKRINPEHQLKNTKEFLKTVVQQGLNKINSSEIYLQISHNTLDTLLTIDNATLAAKALGIGVVTYYTSYFILARSLTISILGARFFSYMTTPVLSDDKGLIVTEGNTKINRVFCSYSIAGLAALIEAAYYYKINPLSAFLGGIAGSEALTKLAPLLSSKLRATPGATLTETQQLTLFLFNILGYEFGRYWVGNVLNRQETQAYWFKYVFALQAQGKLSQFTHVLLNLDSRNSEHTLTELEGSSLTSLFFSAKNPMNIGWKTNDNRFYQAECEIVGEITQYPVLPTITCNAMNLLGPRLNYV